MQTRANVVKQLLKDNLGLQVMTRKEFMKYLQISDRTEAYWKLEKKIPYIKLGRRVYYKVEDVMAFLDNNKQSK